MFFARREVVGRGPVARRDPPGSHPIEMFSETRLSSPPGYIIVHTCLERCWPESLPGRRVSRDSGGWRDHPADRVLTHLIEALFEFGKGIILVIVITKLGPIKNVSVRGCMHSVAQNWGGGGGGEGWKWV